jgi:hypothetical protein
VPYRDFDDAIAYVKENPERYVIKPSGAAANVKRRLFVGDEDDGQDVIRLRFDLWLGTRIRKSNGDVSFFGLHMIGICGRYAYRTEQRWVAQGRIRQAF